MTDSFNGVIQHTSTGLVQAGVLSYGTHVLIPGEADIYGLYVNVYLNPDNNPRIVTNQSGYWLMGNTVSVDFIFPNLSPLEFTGLWNFYHDSAHGYSALSLGDTPNSLRFAFAGEFYNPYGGAFTDWWGYSTAINPNANLGTGGNGDAGPGNSAVPEPSTYGLIGATALFGLSAFRKRRMSKSAACL